MAEKTTGNATRAESGGGRPADETAHGGADPSRPSRPHLDHAGQTTPAAPPDFSRPFEKFTRLKTSRVKLSIDTGA
jgi:hypothetical protein